MKDSRASKESEAEVLKLSKEKFSMMQNSDVTSLDRILADDFTLTHLTGHVASRNEWLSDLKSKRFIYHHIDQKEFIPQVHGHSAVVITKSVFDATIYGFRGEYRLQLTENYQRTSDEWKLMSMNARTY